MRHLSLFCKIQQGREHEPCHSQECTCEECYQLEFGAACECECHL